MLLLVSKGITRGAKKISVITLLMTMEKFAEELFSFFNNKHI